MGSRYSMDSPRSVTDSRRSSGSSGRSEEHYQRPPRIPVTQQHGEAARSSSRTAWPNGYEHAPNTYKVQLHQDIRSADTWSTSQGPSGPMNINASSAWQEQPSQHVRLTNGSTSLSNGASGSNGRYSWTTPPRPSPPLRRISSSEDASLGELRQAYYTRDMASSMGSLPSKTTTTTTAIPQRRPSNRDEFDGPSQFLSKPNDSVLEPTEAQMPTLPITLYAHEQDDILAQVNDRLSQCAFDFVAKYQFPIPIEADKRPVRGPLDREWSEWVYLLKRLATKRRIPARVLYNGQIKQFITILENSLEMRHAAKHQSRPLKDDRNVLQLISSGLQVAKILKDAPAMQALDGLYVRTEGVITERRARAAAGGAAWA